MSLVWSILIASLIGSLGAWRQEIDVNRVRLVSKEEGRNNKYPSINPHRQRSIFPHKYKRNDYDNHSSGIPKLRPPLQLLPGDLPPTAPKAIKIHQPREDPRFFYLSEAYIKEVNEKNLNNEITAVYPGREVIRADNDYRYDRQLPIRLQAREVNDIPGEFTNNVCVKCPNDRTFIAKAGSDRVILPPPHLSSCSGFRVPRGVKFDHMYGPKLGSLLEEGSYSIVGCITFKEKILKHCVMEVRVLTQTCPMPKYLVEHCEDENKTCNFSCRDANAELLGQPNLTCGDDKKWIGELPICKVRSWCEAPSPPPHGRISCKGSTVDGSRLADGSTCRVRCARGWQRRSHPLTVCRRGAWTHELSCTQRRN